MSKSLENETIVGNEIPFNCDSNMTEIESDTTSPSVVEPLVNPNINSTANEPIETTEKSWKCSECDLMFKFEATHLFHKQRYHSKTDSIKSLNKPKPKAKPKRIVGRDLKNSRQVLATEAKQRKRNYQKKQSYQCPTTDMEPTSTVNSIPNNTETVGKQLISNWTPINDSTQPFVIPNNSKQTLIASNSSNKSNLTLIASNSTIQLKPIGFVVPAVVLPVKEITECYKCKNYFPNREVLLRHLAKVHEIYPKPMNITDISKTTPVITPLESTSVTSNITSNPTLEQTLITSPTEPTTQTAESDELLKCFKCNICFVNQSLFSFHMSHIHRILFNSSAKQKASQCNVCGYDFFGKLNLLKHKERDHLNVLARYECSWKSCRFMAIDANEWSKHEFIHEKRGELIVNKRHNYSTIDLNIFSQKYNEFLDLIQEFQFNGNTSELSYVRNGLDSLRSAINLLICGLEEIELLEESNESNNNNNNNNSKDNNEINGRYETIDMQLYSALNSISNEENTQTNDTSIENSNQEMNQTISETTNKLRKKRIKYVCDWKDCKKLFDKIVSLKVHKLTHQEKSYRCQSAGCGAAFTQQKYLELHQVLHEDKYRCSQENCKHRARNSRDFEAHKQRHDLTRERDKPLECEVNGCDKRFRRRYLVVNHQLVAHPEHYPDVEWAECSQCSHRTKSSYDMTEHIRRNHKKPFACNQCDKTFSNNCQLVQHLSVHAGLKQHKCSQCGAEFYCKKTLKTHIERIHNEKTFFCKVDACGKAFGSEAVLSDHTRVAHGTGPKKIPCEWPGCDLTFNCIPIMKDHLNRHTGARPYLCDHPGCDYKSGTKARLRMHCKEQHNIQLDGKRNRYTGPWLKDKSLEH